jgi:hypothetical protein
MVIGSRRRRVASAGLALGMTLLFAACDWHVAGADEAQSADDGWRRTAYGWQRIEDLQSEAWGIPRRQPDRFITNELSRPQWTRWDFHPGALALGQLMVVAAAFAGVRHQVRLAATAGAKGRETALGKQESVGKAA